MKTISSCCAAAAMLLNMGRRGETVALTKEEKSARWDALQVAIRFTAETYRARRQEQLRNYEAYGADTGILGAYSKGMADAYGLMIETLERWTE